MRLVTDSKLVERHCHSNTFSDGRNSPWQLLNVAAKLGLTELRITDHSDTALKVLGIKPTFPRSVVRNWHNTYHGVQTSFDIEGDIIDAKGTIDDKIQGLGSDYMVLSAHAKVYQGDPRAITDAYLQAIDQHADKIGHIGHPTLHPLVQHLDIEKLAEAANAHKIPLELNGKYLRRTLELGKDIAFTLDMKKTRQMLAITDSVIVCSDAHDIEQLSTCREYAMEWLRKENIPYMIE